MVGDVLLAEILGIFFAEELVQVLAGIVHFLAAGDEDGEVGHQEDAFQQGHGVFVQVFPNHVAHKEQLGFGVVHDVVYVVGLEFMQNGYDDCSIGQGGEECHAPVRAVASADGYLVSFPDAAGLKDNV